MCSSRLLHSHELLKQYFDKGIRLFLYNKLGCFSNISSPLSTFWQMKRYSVVESFIQVKLPLHASDTVSSLCVSYSTLAWHTGAGDTNCGITPMVILTNGSQPFILFCRIGH